MSLECRVMILDDEESIQFSLREILIRNGYQVECHSDPTEAIGALSSFKPQIVVADYALPKMDGLEFMSRVLAKSPDTLILFMTAYGSEELAVEAMKRGAYDYFKKPFRNDAVLVSIAKAREKLELLAENRRLRDEALEKGTGLKEFVGSSPRIRGVFEMIDRIATANVTVLIQGESGTGKELIATAVHRRSNRAARPFVKLNCAALPEALVESELFGYEAGAFTGASKARVGKFEQADGGTLFLDEIGDMPLSTQTKVLRVIQEKEIERLGSNKVRPVDVRIVAATHQNLEKRVERKEFREDLYYRLNVVNLQLPALRERPEDIPLLVEHFMSIYRDKFGLACPGPEPADLERFLAYPWPGNVRELENSVARGVLLGSFRDLPGDSSPKRALSQPPPGPGGVAGTPAPASEVEMELPYREAERLVLDRFESDYLQRLLSRTAGNVAKAARLAGMDRKTIYEKMNRLGLHGGGGD